MRNFGEGVNTNRQSRENYFAHVQEQFNMSNKFSAPMVGS